MTAFVAQDSEVGRWRARAASTTRANHQCARVGRARWLVASSYRWNCRECRVCACEIKRDGEPGRHRHRRFRAAGRDYGRSRGGESQDEVGTRVAEDAGEDRGHDDRWTAEGSVVRARARARTTRSLRRRRRRASYPVRFVAASARGCGLRVSRCWWWVSPLKRLFK